MSEAQILDAMGSIKFAPIRIKPSFVRLNPYSPPEFELRFEKGDNPTLWAAYNKVRSQIQNRNSEIYTGFHMSITRKIEFRSPEDEKAFLVRGQEAVEHWRKIYPNGTLLQPSEREELNGNLLTDEYAIPGWLYLFWNRNDIRAYFPPTEDECV